MKGNLWLSLLACVWFMSCNDPSSLGVEFLKDTELDVRFIDTLTVNAMTLNEDSVLVFDPDNPNLTSTFIAGELDDPIFGNTKASFYTQVTTGFLDPTLSEAFLDSIIFSLAYDTSALYGDLDQLQSIEVYRVTEDIDVANEAYSNKGYETGELLGGLYDFKINAYARRTIQEPGSSTTEADTVSYDPHIRIPLFSDFGHEIISLDTAGVLNSTEIQEYIKGFHVVATGSKNAMMGFNLDNEISRLTIYYTRKDEKKKYDFNIGNFNKRVNSFIHNYEGTQVEPYINAPDQGDSLLFVQGMAGLNIFGTFPHIENVKDLIINKAELIFYVAELPEDDAELFPPANQLITYEEIDEPQFIKDIYFDLGGIRTISTISGGFIEEEENTGLAKYTINLSSHLQNILSGNIDNKFYIGVHLSNERPPRSAVYGPGHSSFPMKLNIIYTVN